MPHLSTENHRGGASVTRSMGGSDVCCYFFFFPGVVGSLVLGQVMKNHPMDAVVEAKFP